MTAQPVKIVIDNRARLLSAVLTLTNWPDKEQNFKRHRAHVHARKTGEHIQDYVKHEAVHALQTLLDQGTPLAAVYTYALNLTWPDMELTAPMPWAPVNWAEQLRDFFDRTQLAAWWDEEAEIWQRAQEQTQKIIAEVDFRSYFEPFIGPVNETLLLMPNVSYPSDMEVGVRLDDTLFCLVPPRIAWGDNEPWPFDEDAAHIIRGALSQYARLLMVTYLRQNAAEIAPTTSKPLPVSAAFKEKHPTWGDQFTALFVAGSVALFLEEVIGQKEAKAYILMEHKVNGLKILPGVVNVLKRYLGEHAQGRYANLAEYLPNFGTTLRVARRMISL
ncbi:MAG: hypothetical protein K8S97_05595 [Anaerolineae bacterium]|nr:hypothetical protein [Anaerolineae bacterium]